MRDRLRDLSRSGLDLVQGGSALVRWPVFSLTSFRMVRGLVRQGIEPRLVIDVGANRGQFSTAVLELVPQADVVAFEPIPAAAEMLRTLNTRWPDRLTVIESAVGAEPGRATLTINSHSQSSSLRTLTAAHLTAFPGAVPEGQVDVEVVRLDDALGDRALGGGSLLKVDAQGLEREVLTGAGDRLTEFEHVIIEASFRPLYEGEWTFTDLLDFAGDKGLRFVRPVGSLRDPHTGEYLQMDALFRSSRS